MSRDQMTWQDIKPSEQVLGATKIISAGRFEKSINEIPFTIFVISGEEIRANGYTTLTEALKMLPGIKAHEVGSAFDGGSFMMRGFNGNIYTKFLINDVALKPFVVGGMPIGAQLPIQQAERIEVLFGPSATIYGADATAGVINIITKKYTRPFSVNASINVGNYGYKSMNLWFGIRKGSSKNPLELDFYANHTIRDTRPIVYNVDSIYLNFQKNPIIDSLQNYITVDGKPIFGKLPHISHSVGMRLHYFDFNVNVDIMSRADHSALGMVPYSMSYANSLNFFGEDIISTNIIYQKNITSDITLKAILNRLEYKTKEGASAKYVLPTAGEAYLIFQQDLGIGNGVQNLEKNVFGGDRSLEANSIEKNLEVILQYKPYQYANFSFGFSSKFGEGSPIIPILYDPDFQSYSFLNTYKYKEYSGFGEANLQWQKLNATVGLQLMNRQDENDKFNFEANRIIYNPRLGLLYELSPQLNLRGSVSKGFRNPSPFYNSTSVAVNFNAPNYIGLAFNQFQSERTVHYDLGARYNTPILDVDMSLYNLKTYGLINFIPAEDSFYYFLQWSNDSISLKTVYGAQLFAAIRNIYKPLGWNARFSINYTFGNEKFTTSINNSISDVKQEIFVLDALRGQPKWIIKMQHEFKLKNWSLILQNQWMSSVQTSSISWTWSNTENRTNPGFHVMDCILKYKLSNNNQFRIGVYNVLNAQYAGISADQTFESLTYNPQPLRTWAFGVDYNLN